MYVKKKKKCTMFIQKLIKVTLATHYVAYLPIPQHRYACTLLSCIHTLTNKYSFNT